MKNTGTGHIFDIKKFAVHDGPGIRSTVFFKGCPLKCQWCHNPESISFQSELQYMEQKCIGCGACVGACPQGAHSVMNGVHHFDRSKCIACGACEKECPGHALVLCGKCMTVDEAVEVVLQDKNFYEQSGGGVTLSGGECLCQEDFCTELLMKLKRHGIHCAVDTSGFVSRKAIEKVEPYTDLFLYDIKHMDEEKHIQYTGQSNRKILENLIYLNETGRKIEIRIPLIPGINDMMMNRLGSFLHEIKFTQKVKLLPYNHLAGSKYLAVGKKNTMPDVQPPEQETIEEMISILKSYGIDAISD